METKLNQQARDSATFALYRYKNLQIQLVVFPPWYSKDAYKELNISYVVKLTIFHDTPGMKPSNIMLSQMDHQQVVLLCNTICRMKDTIYSTKYDLQTNVKFDPIIITQKQQALKILPVLMLEEDKKSPAVQITLNDGTCVEIPFIQFEILTRYLDFTPASLLAVYGKDSAIKWEKQL